jgi:hypothetical protein
MALKKCNFCKICVKFPPNRWRHNHVIMTSPEIFMPPTTRPKRLSNRPVVEIGCILKNVGEESPPNLVKNVGRDVLISDLPRPRRMAEVGHIFNFKMEKKIKTCFIKNIGKKTWVLKKALKKTRVFKKTLKKKVFLKIKMWPTSATVLDILYSIIFFTPRGVLVQILAICCARKRAKCIKW